MSERLTHRVHHPGEGSTSRFLNQFNKRFFTVPPDSDLSAQFFHQSWSASSFARRARRNLSSYRGAPRRTNKAGAVRANKPRETPAGGCESWLKQIPETKCRMEYIAIFRGFLRNMFKHHHIEKYLTCQIENITIDSMKLHNIVIHGLNLSHFICSWLCVRTHAFDYFLHPVLPTGRLQ